jgi:hypothetical protein
MHRIFLKPQSDGDILNSDKQTPLRVSRRRLANNTVDRLTYFSLHIPFLQITAVNGKLVVAAKAF